MLDQKSLTELRTIAQGLGVSDIFSKAPNQLIQDIERKHKELIPQEKIAIPLPHYDARLMTATPGEMCSKEVLLDLLTPYIKRGLKVELGDETWKFSFGKKTDTGTLRMPLRTAIKKAQEVLA